MPQWTQAQSNAVNAEGRNITVSAAAGSGKTAVLVGRVIRMITDSRSPVDVDKLLIVTFTNAAAAEMRSRISLSLKEILKNNPSDANARRQLSLLSNAKICTIDSFCIGLVRENFFNLGINNDFRNMDESELSLTEDAVIDSVLNDYYEADDPDFITLAELFTTPGSDKALIQTIKKTLRYIYAQPFPYRWLEEMAQLHNPDIPYEKTVWYDYSVKEINYLLDYALSLVNANFDIVQNKMGVDFTSDDAYGKLLDVVKSDKEEILSFKSALDDSVFKLYNKKAYFTRLPNTKSVTEKSLLNIFKSNRSEYKNILTKSIQSFLISSEEEYTENAEYVYRVISKITEVVKEVDKRLTQEKKDRNAFSFSDTEHFAIDLLFEQNESGEVIRTPLAQNLSQNFYEILVDEYQDTNDAQDLLFKYLSNGRNLFVVGDVKQSIYRFRLAMPDIFNRRRKECPYYDENDNSDSSKIILDKNFRSRKGICEYVNFVFSNLMTEKVGELNYDSDEYLNYAASYEDTSVSSAQIKILDTSEAENPIRSEALYIAKTIEKKVKGGELVKDGNEYRKVCYGDFAILMRSLKGKVNEYADALTAYGIPVICDNTSDLFESGEIKMIMSLIKAVDNPTLDIPLLAVMQSPIYSFTADELSQLRIDNRKGSFYFCVKESDSEKAVNFIDDLTRLRRLSVTMSVAGFIRYVVEEKGIVSLVNAMGNGEQRYGNILKLISFADNFDKGDNVGLTSFIRYINKIDESDSKVDAASMNYAGSDAVTIMSIHHSKGLEFPICILAGASGKYNLTDLNQKLLLNTGYGFAVKSHNEESLYQYKSIAYQVIRDKNNYELMSENLRVLYVAMTRAKEQFITFIRCDNIQKKIISLASDICFDKINPYVCKRVSTDADFILLCALLHKDGEELRNLAGIDGFQKTDFDFDMDIEIKDSIEVENEKTDIDFVDADDDTVKAIGEKLSYEYPRMPLSSMSLKLTASALDDSENNFEYTATQKPAFMCKSDMTPAERGTAMHAFMQFCDYKSARKNLEGEITALADRRFLTDAQANSLDRKALSAFFNSDFADRIFNSDKLYKELHISSFVEANKLYDTQFDDKILIEGIADCVFEEDGKLVLVDYKTDRVTDEQQLLDRYKKQVSFYRYAIEKTLQKPVKETALYSFCLQKVCLYK